MNDLKVLWATRRKKQAALDSAHPTGALYVTPIENREANTTAGIPCAVSTEVAARLLLAGGHRESTPEEIEAAVEHGERNRRAASAATNRNEGRTVLTLQVDQPRPVNGRKAPVKE